MAPGIVEDNNLILSGRPMFLWQGDVDEIELKDYYTDEVIWRANVSGDRQS